MTYTNRPLVHACLLSALAYIATTWISMRLLAGAMVDAPIAMRVVVGLLPVIPIGLAIRAFVQLMRAGDELQRRIDVEALAIAALAIGLGALTASLLIVAGAFDTTAQKALVWVFPALVLTYLFARILACRRYG